MGYDVIVVGGGFAGISASFVTSAWGRLRTLVLEAEKPPDLWSYPRRHCSLMGMSGADLIQRMVEEAKSRGVQIHTGERVVDLRISKGGEKIVKTLKKDYACDALVLATGARWKTLQRGESWLGRGTSYCAACDGQFFEGSNMIVVGSENVAAQEALTLSQMARNVALVTHSEKLEAESPLVDELKRRGIEVMEGYEIMAVQHEEFNGEVKVEMAKIETGEPRSLQTDGILIALGLDPMALKAEKIGVRTHRQGGILVDSRQQTNVEGVLAAGDCTCGGGFNLTSSIGDGAKAGLAAYMYVRRLGRKKENRE